MTNHYHNTIGITNPELKMAKGKAIKQSVLILQYMMQHPNKRFTAWMMHDELTGCGYYMLITSVRRSLSDLAKEHLIEHDKTLVMERAGSKNSTYYYNQNTNQLRLL